MITPGSGGLVLSPVAANPISTSMATPGVANGGSASAVPSAKRGAEKSGLLFFDDAE